MSEDQSQIELDITLSERQIKADQAFRQRTVINSVTSDARDLAVTPVSESLDSVEMSRTLAVRFINKRLRNAGRLEDVKDAVLDRLLAMVPTYDENRLLGMLRELGIMNQRDMEILTGSGDKNGFGGGGGTTNAAASLVFGNNTQQQIDSATRDKNVNVQNAFKSIERLLTAAEAVTQNIKNLEATEGEIIDVTPEKTS